MDESEFAVNKEAWRLAVMMRDFTVTARVSMPADTHADLKAALEVWTRALNDWQERDLVKLGWKPPTPTPAAGEK